MQIIPIAGKSSRFKSAGYTVAKYLLPVSGKPVIEHILSYFDKSKPTLLILNKQDLNKKIRYSVNYAKKLHKTIVSTW